MKRNYILMFGLAAVILGGMVVFGGFRGEPEGTMCTMEALMCPDGTGVGREGNACKFKACPQQGSFVGKLTQQSDGFHLIVGAGTSVEGSEVTYSLPLEIKISNVLGQLVGQTVRVHGSFIEGNRYKVDHLEELTPEEVSAANTVTVGVGQTKYVNGIRITLNKVVGDYRCPVDVQCMEAGAITANVRLKSDTDEETFNMASDEVPHKFDSFKVSIVNVAPSRVAAHEPDPNSYQVSFKVENL